MLAMDEEGERGGMVVVKNKDLQQAQLIHLAPLVQVHGKLVFEESAESLDPMPTARMYLVPENIHLATGAIQDSALALQLPPGTYRFSMFSMDIIPVTREFTLTADQPVDMEAVQVSLTGLAQLAGKEPPPWHLTAARGMNLDAQLADFRGRWVLLEFWGFW